MTISILYVYSEDHASAFRPSVGNMDQPQARMARYLPETKSLEVATTASDAKLPEINTKLLVEKAAASACRARNLRVQGYGIGMLLQIHADDLVFVQLHVDDVTLKS